ncbi:MAG: glycosyltransferase [Acidobacteria bacterium]|nr:glycosyltransferase [Acidobacteriota bacterium]
MKVLFVSPAGAMGGAERSLLDLVASLRACDPRLEMAAALLAPGPLAEALGECGVDAHTLEMPASFATIGDNPSPESGSATPLAFLGGLGRAGTELPGFISRFRALVRDARPDIVHTNGNKAHLIASLGARGGPALLWHVRDFIGSRRVMRRALALARLRSSGAIAISDAVRRDLEAAVPGLSVDVVHNAVDVDAFSPGPADGRRLDRLAGAAAPPGDVLRIGLVATYAHWKGHSLFLDAAARVAGSDAAGRCRFYVIGGPIYGTRGSQAAEGDLRAQASSLGLSRRVAFVGFQDDVASVYRDLDVVVHASTQPEPFGRTIVEAMACGRPVVVSRGGGAPEIFTEGEDAVGFMSGDAGDLASVILRLVARPDLRRGLGERGRVTAVTRYSRARLGPEVRTIYERVISAGRIERS